MMIRSMVSLQKKRFTLVTPRNLGLLGVVLGLGLGPLVPQAAAQVNSSYEDEQDWWNPADWFDDTPNTWEFNDDERIHQNAWSQDRGWDGSGLTELNDANNWHTEWEPPADRHSRVPYLYRNVPTHRPVRSQRQTGPTGYAAEPDWRRGSNRQASAVHGQLDSYKRINLEHRLGGLEQHDFVKVRMDSGRETIVDLGRNGIFRQLQVQPGDRISIMGRPGQIEGRDILFARQIRTRDAQYQLNPTTQQWSRNNRPSNGYASPYGSQYRFADEVPDGASMEEGNEPSEQNRDRSQAHADASTEQNAGNWTSVRRKTKTIHGTLQEVSTKEIHGQKQIYVNVETKDGEISMIDLGHGWSDAQRANLQKRARRGDDIFAKGEQLVVEGQDVLRASHYRFDSADSDAPESDS